MGHVQYIYRRVRPKTGKIPAEMKASSKLREYIYNFIALTYYEDTKYSYCTVQFERRITVRTAAKTPRHAFVMKKKKQN